MTAIAAPGLIVPKLIVPSSPWLPTKVGIEAVWDELGKVERRLVDRLLKLPALKDKILMMAGSDANYLSKVLGELAFGKTAYAGETTIFVGLWAAALDDTFLGNTASEAAYTSYGRLSLSNSTTIFAAGTGTTTRTQTWPSDALKSFAASTGTGTNNTITYMGALNGNAGTSSDKGMVWCTVTSVTINSGDTPQLAQNAVSQTRD
jgi:hypothetical protein